MLEMTRPAIDQIEEVIREIPGWSPLDQLHTLFSLVLATSGLEGDVVEIGSWCGRSASVLGLAARYAGNTRVHCIDLFPERDDWYENADGSYSFKVSIGGKTFSGYTDQTVWKEPFLRDIAPLYEKHRGVLEIFQQSVAKAGVADLVRAHRGDAATFFARAAEPFRCRLAFLDGDHSYAAVCDDIRQVDRHLVPGGWICFDDAFSYYDGVNQAITDLIIANPAYDLKQQMTRKCFVARKKPTAMPST
ncbi:MAG: class I SAM-dependent methyltransferase [Pseudomonadota bacterium]